MLQPHLLDETKGTPIIPCFSLNLPKLRRLQIGEYYYVSKSHDKNWGPKLEGCALANFENSSEA